MPPIFKTDLNHILDHTRDLWGEMRGENLFITGGTGFFGRWMLESFLWVNSQLKLKAHLTLLTRNPDVFINNSPQIALADNITFLKGDIRTFTLPSKKYPFVIHAAGESSTKMKQGDLLNMLDIIVDGTRNTLEQVVQHNCKRWLFTSSGAIYGPNLLNLTQIPENASHHEYPSGSGFRSVYCQGKRMAEHLGEIYSELGKVDAINARCFAFIGPHLPLDSHCAAGNFLNDILNNRIITINGDGTPIRSYLYSADLTIWLWTLLFRGKPGKAYNVGSDTAISIEDLARLMVNTLNSKPGLQILRKPVPGAAAESYVPEIKLARDSLGLDVWISPRESIRRTFQWYKQTGNNL